jgi:hypothetical protein
VVYDTFIAVDLTPDPTGEHYKMKKIFAMMLMTLAFAVAGATTAPQDMPPPTCVPCVG